VVVYEISAQSRDKMVALEEQVHDLKRS
jgi:hypothetical protein